MRVFFLIGITTAMLLLLCSIARAQSAGGSSLKLVIIRHGEKPESGANLSCRGFNRAMQLTDVLYAKFKVPDNIFVPSVGNGKLTSTARMYQTIMPFAIKYNLAVNSKYEVDDVEGLAKAVLKKTGTVLIVWEHANISRLVKVLGIESGIKWKGDDFDSIWIINFVNGKPVLTVDRENLNPSMVCN